MKLLFVIDMQNDFIDGALGTKKAQAIVPKVARKIRDYDGRGIIVTQDKHYDWDYKYTLEGKMLPIPHCIKGTPGYEINEVVFNELLKRNQVGDRRITVELFYKPTFGCIEMCEFLKEKFEGVEYFNEPMEFEIVGLCTDICVVSNALLLRAYFPNARILVDSNCCAGTTPEAHEAALKTMESCQIGVIR